MSPPRPIRVLIADDHSVVRKGLHALLATEPDIEVVGEAADGRAAVAWVVRAAPDVVIMDLVMPEGNGIEAIRNILAQRPDTRILVLTSFAGDDQIFPAIHAGAAGYLLKDASPEELVGAIRQVHRGDASLSPSVARTVLRGVSAPVPHAQASSSLTPRELDVLRLVARGLGNQAIADALALSEATVRNHVSSILGKLHLASRTEAALFALREGLASLADSDELPRP